MSAIEWKCPRCGGRTSMTHPSLGYRICGPCYQTGRVIDMEKGSEVIQYIEYNSETGSVSYTDPPEGFDPILFGC